VLAVVFGGALLGLLVGRILPEHHLNTETKSVVPVAMAVLGTLSVLVLGLLISTASGAFATRSQEVTQISTDMIRLDRLLRRYGPETQDIRELLRRYTANKAAGPVPSRPSQVAVDNEAAAVTLDALQDRVLALAPADDPVSFPGAYGVLAEHRLRELRPVRAA
jgi:hypothetical protein